MRELIPTNLVARSILSMVLLLVCPPLGAELPYSSRYFKDQKTRRVVSDVMRVLGDFREGKVYLSERQAIEMALHHNLTINVERHIPLRKRWVVEQNRAVYDPLNKLSLDWDRATTPTSNILQGGTRLTDIFTTLHYDYRQSFANGSSFEVRFDGTRNRTTNFFASLVPAIDTRFELLFRQNLLQGFGRILPDYQIEISRNDVSISEEGVQTRRNRDRRPGPESILGTAICAGRYSGQGKVPRAFQHRARREQSSGRSWKECRAGSSPVRSRGSSEEGGADSGSIQLS